MIERAESKYPNYYFWDEEKKWQTFFQVLRRTVVPIGPRHDEVNYRYIRQRGYKRLDPAVQGKIEALVVAELTRLAYCVDVWLPETLQFSIDHNDPLPSRMTLNIEISIDPSKWDVGIVEFSERLRIAVDSEKAESGLRRIVEELDE